MQTPPDVRGAQLLPIGVLGLGDPPRQLTSDTTHLDGIVAGIDVLPTALDWLGIDDARQGQGPADRARLRPQRRGARVARRPPARRAAAAPAGAVDAARRLARRAAAAPSSSPTGAACAGRCAIGALAALWVPAVVLLTAALEPSRTAELLLVAAAVPRAGGAHRPRSSAWPRGPALPAVVGLAAYVVDLAAGSPLIIRSLLGPNPLFGSRFYGIGNELEATLSALLVIGIGALLYGRGRSRGGRRGVRRRRRGAGDHDRRGPARAPTSAASSPSPRAPRPRRC